MYTQAPALPKNDGELARVMRQHGDRESFRMWSRLVRWNIGALYLAGERRFEVATPWGAVYRMEEMELDENDVPMHIQTMTSIHNRLLGMLNSMDLRPMVFRDDSTLEAFRDKATTQVVLDAAISGQYLEDIKKTLLHYFAFHGSAGLHSQVEDYPSIGLTGELEVVHPREIYPYPSVGTDLGKVRGIMRDRWVPWVAMQECFDIKGGPDQKELEVLRRQPGEGDYFNWGVANPMPMAPRWTSTRDYEPRVNGRSLAKNDEIWVRLRELWRYGPRGTVEEYAAASGTKVFARETYKNVVSYCPLAFDRFYESGDFHGAGIYDLVFSAVREFEKLVRDMVANVKEADRYSTLVLPAGAIDERKFFTHNRQNLRVLTVDPEPKGVYGTSSQQVLRPTMVTPPNAGDLPGRTASFLMGIIKDLAPLRDIVEDKGRVDSFAGLQFLQDEAQKPIANPVSSLIRLWGSTYRYMASKAFNLLAENPKPIKVGRMSLDLVGAVIDPETATMSFMGGHNQVPDITRLRFGVKQTSLKMSAARKTEAIELFKLGVADRTGFLLKCIEEGLDFAIYLEGEKNSYDSIVNQIITLYGDGVTPGEIVSAPYLENPELQLRVLKAFMQSPRMRVASPAVINAFSELDQTLVNWTGKVLPQAVPDPYTAIAQMSAAGRSSGIGGSAGGPPATFSGSSSSAPGSPPKKSAKAVR